MTNTTKGSLMKKAALVMAVGCPIGAAATQFPVWVHESAEATMSGMFLVIVLLSSIPIFRLMRDRLKSPFMPLLWIAFTVVLLALRAIIDDLILIGGIASISNTAGGALYKGGCAVEKKEDIEPEEER